MRRRRIPFWSTGVIRTFGSIIRQFLEIIQRYTCNIVAMPYHRQEIRRKMENQIAETGLLNSSAAFHKQYVIYFPHRITIHVTRNDEKVTGLCVDRNNHTTFLNFLKHLCRNSPGKELHIIMDSLSLHKHKEVTDWVNRRRRHTIHFTPTYASWLSQAEI